MAILTLLLAKDSARTQGVVAPAPWPNIHSLLQYSLPSKIEGPNIHCQSVPTRMEGSDILRTNFMAIRVRAVDESSSSLEGSLSITWR